MSNGFTRKLSHSSPPWRLADPERRGRIINQQDQVVASVPKAGEIDWQTREANLNLILHAPELLEALIHACVHLDAQGVPPTRRMIDLLNACRPGAAPIVHPQLAAADTSTNDDTDPQT